MIHESGDIYFDGIHLVFQNQNRKVQFVLSQIKVHFGGTSGRLAFVQCNGKPNHTMQISDFSIFAHKAFKDHPEVIAMQKRRKAHKNVMIASVVFAALLIMAPLYFIMIDKSSLSRAVAGYVPIEVEEMLGEKLFEMQIKGSSALIKDADVKYEFNKLAYPIVKAIENDTPYKFKFHILDTPTINAFAVPGGHIVFHAGLILAAETPEEIQGVIAHEIAHITHRHSLQQMIHSIGTWVFISALTAGAGDLVGMVAQNVGTLSVKSYSREQETEADVTGFEYLIMASIDPAGMVRFFDLLMKEEPNYADSAFYQILSTHPGSEDRKLLLQKKLDQLHGARLTNPHTSSFNLKKFQDKVRLATQKK